MRRLRAWFLRLAGTFSGAARDSDFAHELDSHLRLHIADNVRAGMPPEEARRQAILALGGIESIKEQYRDRRAFPWLAHLVQDAGYGFRSLRGHLGFAAAAIAILALGFGANLAVFRFLDTVLLESLPVDRPDRLVLVGPWAFSYPAYREFAARNGDVLVSTAARWATRVNLTADGTIEHLPAELVSGSYFDTLGVKAVAGRLLGPDDDGTEGAHAVCVISYGLWQRRFAGDPLVVGRTIELNARPFEIVGVTPRGFTGADLHARYDLQIPMSMTSMFMGMQRDSSEWTWLTMFGRLAPGVSREQAEAVVRTRFQPTYDYQKRAPLVLRDGRQGSGSLRLRLAEPVVIAQLLSACVLLIACANLVGLLLARTAARRHELAIRRALGASRGRVVSQLVIESVLLASVGAAVGAGLAAVLAGVLGGMLSAPGSNLNLPLLPSTWGLTAVLVLVAVAVLAIGLVPAIIATGDAALDGLRDTPRTGPRTGWLGQSLVVAQVVVSLVLAFAAGLFARSLHNLRTVDLGLDPHHVVVVAADPEQGGYSQERARGFYGEWLRRARQVPGVSSVSLANVTALSGAMFAGYVSVPDAKRPPGPNNNFNIVTGEYFSTVGIPLLAGRTFSERDTVNAPPVAVVNQQFVEYYWPGRLPIGRHIPVFGKDVEIIGVVRTAKYTAVREDPQITIYFPVAQRPVHDLTLHARVTGPASPAIAALINAARDIDFRVPVHDAGTLEEHVDARLANERILSVLSVVFASLAMLVACAGLYALVAYSVARRTREIGIRVAIGAQRGEILRLFIGHAVALVAIGIAIGVPLSFVAGRQFGSLLYGVEPSSISTLILASVILAAVAVIAAALPATRAARVDPVGALRQD